MTTQLNLLGMLSSKGAPAAALASSETAAVLPQSGSLPAEGSFFSALMQMLFRQSVDPRTIKKAVQDDPNATPEEKAEAVAPKDRVADSIRALAFLSRETSQIQTEQLQTAIQQCDAQLKLKLPGEPGALLSYLVADAEENHAGAVKKVALEAAPDAVQLLAAESGSGSAETTASDAAMKEILTALNAPSGNAKNGSALPVLSIPAEVPVLSQTAIGAQIPFTQSGTAAVPMTATEDHSEGIRKRSSVPSAVLPQQAAAAPVRSNILPSVPSAPEQQSERKSSHHQAQHAPDHEPLNRTPYSTTVQIPRNSYAVPQPSPAVTASDGVTPQSISIPISPLPGGSKANTSETEQLPDLQQHQQQPVPEAAARSVMPQRNLRSEKKNESQRPDPERSSFGTKLSDAAAFLDDMIAGEEVKVVYTSAGREKSAASQQETQQNSQQSQPQNVPAEGPAPRPAQQKDPSLVPMDRSAIGAPAPAESKSVAAPAAAVHTQPFDRTTVQNMLEQLSKGVAVAVNEHHSQMKIVMHPESLGEVTVRVQVEEGKVSTSMDVQQTQVKQTIEANIPQLREALSAKGLTMERIEVTTAQHGMTDESARQRQGNERKKGRHEFELAQEDESSVKHFGYNTVEYTV